MTKIVVCGTDDNKDILNELITKKNYDVVEYIDHGDEIWRNGKLKHKNYKGAGRFLYDKIFEDIFLFVEMQSRFTERYLNDYINDFNKFFDYFADLLIKNDIKLVLFLAHPHTAVDFILYKIARELKIQTLICTQSNIPDKFYYHKTMEDFGKFEECVQLNEIKYVTIEDKFEKFHWYVNNLPIPELRPFSILKLIRRFITKKNPQFFKKQLEDRKYLERRKGYIDYKVDYSKKYVYFPLHLQPEYTTCPLGGKFSDQILAIEWITKLIPNDWFIYIKDQYYQDSYCRGDGFFERLKALKNVKMVPIETNTFDLIRNCIFVATITGTVGWEAITGGKNALIFGQTWYETFPGVFKYNLDLKLEDILNYKINHSELEEKYSVLLSKFANGVIYRPSKVIVENYDEHENLIKVVNSIDYLIQFVLNEDKKETCKV